MKREIEEREMEKQRVQPDSPTNASASRRAQGGIKKEDPPSFFSLTDSFSKREPPNRPTFTSLLREQQTKDASQPCDVHDSSTKAISRQSSTAFREESEEYAFAGIPFADQWSAKPVNLNKSYPDVKAVDDIASDVRSKIQTGS